MIISDTIIQDNINKLSQVFKVQNIKYNAEFDTYSVLGIEKLYPHQISKLRRNKFDIYSVSIQDGTLTVDVWGKNK
jgi:predicted nucleic-acid-binding Zn-ribbon protein